MAKEITYRYEKWDPEKLEMKYCPTDDKDGSVTGKFILNVPKYFDENPEERIRLGWIKHITHDNSDVEYNKQTQFVVWTTKQIDPYTIEDEPHIMTKSEDQLAFEEMLSVAQWGTVSVGGFRFG
jgi:hypothetical protein